MKNVLIAALLGALTVFVFGFLVYGALGLHLKTVSSFEDPGAVAAVLRANAKEPGLYYFPSPTDATGAMVDENAFIAAAAEGPWAMVSVRPAGVDMTSVTPMIRGFLIEFFAALIVASVLFNLRPACGYGCRALTAAAMGAFAGLVNPVLQWNWMYDATGFSFFTAGVNLATWLLGGLVIARFARPAAA